MKKILLKPRENWQEKCENKNFYFHSIDGKYWIEDYAIEFSSFEIERLKQAGNELHSMCLDLASDTVKSGNYQNYHLPNHIIEQIEKSWQNNDFNIYGRFDISYDGTGFPKMLEYNADTPTSLLESSVIQADWFKEQNLEFSNFNSISEKLIKKWKDGLSQGKISKEIYFSSDMRSAEEWGNVQCLMDTATQAGLNPHFIDLQNINFDFQIKEFLDQDNKIINTLFKLYPWEFLIEEELYPYLEISRLKMIEPMWKMLLSTKAILPLLWERHKNHPNLLPAFFQEEKMKKISLNYVKKPILSREGENVFIYDNENLIETQYGQYGKEGYIYQQRKDLVCFDGRYSMIGLWMIDNEASGLGIREDSTLITQNSCLFLPHYIKN